MIARVHGRVLSVEPDSLVVDVAGVGYRVRVPQSLLQEVQSAGEVITLHTHLHVRENEMTLYGCTDEEQLALFQALIRVSGIGPRTALNIISAVSHQALRESITSGDVAALVRIPGIGKRTAERMITDLKDKLGSTGAPSQAGLSTGDAEVVAALTALGYSAAEALQATRALPPAEDSPLEERIRLALRSFARG